jgi:hypothetical protein
LEDGENVVLARSKKDKDRINVGVKWAKMTGDRTNISFAGRKNNFSYRKYDVRTMGERNNVLMSRNAFFNQRDCKGSEIATFNTVLPTDKKVCK